jgi:aminomethyltransferase
LRTALYEIHKKYGAKFINFHNWEMPLQYKGILEEHKNVRKNVGLFDISHMGRLEIYGKDSLNNLEYLTTNRVSKLEINQAQYSLICNENGGVIDDLTLYRIDEDYYMLCVNASNRIKDYNWIKEHIKGDAKLKDISGNTSELAIQGPLSEKVLDKLTDINISEIGYYRFKRGKISNIDAIISRTGYTGEDGFEIYFDNKYSTNIWESIINAGKEFGIEPVGLGARDTLRIEMRYHLYGNELTENYTPIEAGLKWVVKLDKPNFIGRKRIEEQIKSAPKKKLIGFELSKGGGIPRSHYSIIKERTIGEVTSGTFSPSLNKPIGIGYVDSSYANIGEDIYIEIRNKKIDAKIVKTPFYHGSIRRKYEGSN